MSSPLDLINLGLAAEVALLAWYWPPCLWPGWSGSLAGRVFVVGRHGSVRSPWPLFLDIGPGGLWRVHPSD